MKLFPAIFLVLAPLFLQAQEPAQQKGKTKTYYYHKKLKMYRGKMVNGKREGTWYSWARSGDLHSISNFREGKLHGPYTEYSYYKHEPFYDLKIKENYKEALKTQAASLDTPLNVYMQGDYKTGLKNGTWRTYYGGLLQAEYSYVNDTLEGLASVYDFFNTEPSQVIHYKKGFIHGTYQRFDRDGKLVDKCDYVDGKRTGKWTVYNEKGHTTRQLVDNIPHGLSLSYDKNDSLISSSVYVNGIQHGPFMETSYDNRKITGVYVNGLKEGVVQVHRKGRLYSETYMQHGKKNGFYRLYNDSTGKLELSGFYKDDLSDSTWTSIGEYGTCTIIHQKGKVIKNDCINKGVKTKTFYIDKNRNEVTIFWHDNKFKKSENIYGNLYWIDHSWDAKGKILERDTIWRRDLKWKQENPASDSVYENTSEAPKFKGGYKALEKYININVQYPAVDVESYIEGKVYVQFTVLPDGKIQDLEIKRSPSKTISAEVLRVLSKMHAWQPGVRNGKAETSKVMLSINFEIPEDMLPKPIKLHQDQ